MKAYLASALTGLSRKDRAKTFGASDRVSRACKDLGIQLYEPRTATDPVHHPHVPDEVVFRVDRRNVLEADVLLFLGDQPSTGAGQELAIAKAALIPIVVIAHEKARLSRMVTGILTGSDALVRYSSMEGLYEQLTHTLPQLLDKVRPFPRADISEGRIFGTGLRAARKARDLTYESLADLLSHAGIGPSQLQEWESSDDGRANPSLIELKALAGALGVSVGELLRSAPR